MLRAEPNSISEPCPSELTSLPTASAECSPSDLGLPGIELWELPTADDGAAASREVSVGETEATRHPERAATVAAVAG